MPQVMNLACVLMRMTINEALVACTLNSAGMCRCLAFSGQNEMGTRIGFGFAYACLVDDLRVFHVIPFSVS